MQDAFKERIYFVPHSQGERQRRQNAVRIVEMPCLEIVVIALQRLHRAARAVIGEAHQKVGESIACVSSEKIPVAYRILANMEAVVAMLPFHAELHLVMAPCIVNRVGNLEMTNAHILRALVGRGALKALETGDIDHRPTLFRCHDRIAEPLNASHAVDVDARPDRAEDEWRIIKRGLRHVQHARSKDMRLSHRPVLRFAVQVAALQRRERIGTELIVAGHRVASHENVFFAQVRIHS